jgi:hypothetical protein
LPQIERDDLVSIGPDAAKMITGLYRAGRNMTAEEEEAGEPEQAMDERGDSLV